MVFEKVREFIIDQLGVSVDEIQRDTDLLKDLEADSLDAVEIIMALEDEYDLDIPDEVALKFRTVKDIVKYVEARV